MGEWKEDTAGGSGILWEGGHTGTRATTPQQHTWRPPTSCLAQGQELTHCHIFSTRHNGRGWARASLRLFVKSPRDSGSLTIPPGIFLWATKLWVPSLWADLDHSQSCWSLPVAVEVQPCLYLITGDLLILSSVTSPNYCLGQNWWKTPNNPVLWLCL